MYSDHSIIIHKVIENDNIDLVFNATKSSFQSVVCVMNQVALTLIFKDMTLVGILHFEAECGSYRMN
jgi:hypothetical protein